MKFSALCVTALLASVTTAFSPVRPALLSTTTTSTSAMAQLVQRSPTTSMTRKSQTALSMGMFEDFLAGRDADKRSQENSKYLAKLAARVDKINALEPTIEDLGDDELTAKTKEFQQRLAAGEDLNGPLLEEAFAVVREAAWYVWSIPT